MNNLLKTIFTATLIVLQIGCSKLSKEDGSSNEDMFEKIASLTLSQPEKALAMLDSVERIGEMHPYNINLLRCLIYHNGYSDYHKALRYGLAAYNMPDAPRNAEARLRLIELITDEYLNNGDYTSSVRFCTEGLKLAQDSLVTDMEANLHVTLGLNLLEIGNEEDAFSHLRSAIDILASQSQKAGNSNTTDDYIYAIGMTVNSLIETGHYDEAAGLMDEYMTAVDQLDRLPDAIDGIADCRRSSGYAVMAYLYSKKGEPDKANKYYNLYCDTDYSSAPEGEQIRIPYLLASRRYEEALDYIRREKRLWHESADTISHAYVDEHLKHEREAYEGLGDFHSANRVAHIIETISDSLRARERSAEALELAEIYKTNEQAVQLEHQAYSLKIRNVAIVFSLILVALAAAFIMRVLRQKRVITQKNSSMAATIDELMGFKDKLLETQAENIKLRDLLEERGGSGINNSDAETCADVDESENVHNDQAENESVLSTGLSDRDRDLWERMNHDIIERRLYLEPELSKNWLIKNYRIPVNKFASLFKSFAGCSFSHYIQNCRLDHAVRMIRQHPNWSLDNIARESQMSKTTFYSRFQTKYGMSPSEFKDKHNSGVGK